MGSGIRVPAAGEPTRTSGDKPGCAALPLGWFLGGAAIPTNRVETMAIVSEWA